MWFRSCQFYYAVHILLCLGNRSRNLRSADTSTWKNRSSPNEEAVWSARNRFDDWAQRVGADILHEDKFASFGEVMRRYEAGAPPFAETGEKKQEFPDAVALATLEGWAEDRNSKFWSSHTTKIGTDMVRSQSVSL